MRLSAAAAAMLSMLATCHVRQGVRRTRCEQTQAQHQRKHVSHAPAQLRFTRNMKEIWIEITIQIDFLVPGVRQAGIAHPKLLICTSTHTHTNGYFPHFMETEHGEHGRGHGRVHECMPTCIRDRSRPAALARLDVHMQLSWQGSPHSRSVRGERQSGMRASGSVACAASSMTR